jgi:hypothetical protein
VLPKWLNSGKASEVGQALAEDVVLRPQPAKAKKRKFPGRGIDPQRAELQKFLQRLLQGVDLQARPRRPYCE